MLSWLLELSSVLSAVLNKANWSISLMEEGQGRIISKEELRKRLVSDSCKEAWAGFKGWWIPLCIVSFFLLMTQSWIPDALVKQLPELHVFDYPIAAYDSLVETITVPVTASDQKKIEEVIHDVASYFQSSETYELIKSLVLKIMIISAIASLIAILIHVTLILFAKAACDDHHFTKKSCGAGLKKAPHLYFSYLFFGIIKVIPWFFFIIPGFIVYIRLYFTGFVITEESVNPIHAIKRSWQLTKGNFGPVTVIFLITLVFDALSVLSFGLGFIPGTSFKYTLRASVYKMLKHIEQV